MNETMNTTEARTIHGTASLATFRELAGGSAAEAITAVSAIVLAVLGLAGVLSLQLAAIATIILGASFLVEGWVAGAAHRTTGSAQAAGVIPMSHSGGISAQALAGLAGIVLGILALFRADAELLVAISVLVFGATMLLRAWATYYPTFWLATPSEMSATEGAPRLSASGWSGQVLVGFAATVLGILAVVGLAPLTLSLAGLLSVGAALLLGGAVGQTGASYAP
jgi:hypothetical protein